jgi:glycosyltransferase involved in cell wall biosynthesis
MLQNPRFSIITTTYNRKDFLFECLESVATQNPDRNEFEHIIIDGFSNDGTFEIVKKYKNKHPNINIKILQQEPKGVYPAMNLGLRVAKGNFINFLNSDDYFSSENILNIVNKYIEENPKIKWFQGPRIQAFYPKMRTRKAPAIIETNINRNGLISSIFRALLLSHQSAFIHKSIYEKFGNFDEKYKYSGDFDFFERIKKCSIKNIPEDIAIQRAHHNSLTMSHQGTYFSRYKYLPEVIEILWKYRIKVPNPSHH